LKKTISAFDLAAIIAEIKDECIGARINNIYQIDSIYILKLRGKNRTINLLIEPEKRVHVTEYEREKPRIPPHFCTTLRKYLRRKIIIDFRQYKFDRVLIIKAARRYKDHESGNINYTDENILVCEFFNRGILTLLNNENKVIIASSYKTMRDRRIIPNREFSFAPFRGIDLYNFQFDDFKNLIKNSENTIINFLAREAGFGGTYAEELCLRLNIDKKLKINNLDDLNIEKLYSLIKIFMEKIKNRDLEPRIVLKDGEYYSFEPFNLLLYKDYEYIEKENFNQAVDDYFSKGENLKLIKQDISEKESQIGKIEKIIQTQKKAIERLEKKAEIYSKYGDITYQYIEIINEIFETLKNARNKGYSWNEIKSLINEAKQKNQNSTAKFIKDIKPSESLIILNFDSLDIPYDFRLTPQENATNFYDISKKSRKKVEGAKKALEQSLKKLEKEELEKELISKKPPELIKKRKKFWFEKFHWFISSDGYLVLGGRDIKTNEILFRKYLEKNDIFLHADFRGSPAVIIKISSEKPEKIPESTLLEAGQFTVAYSSAWKSKYMAADAYWVNSEQVSQTPPSGQYLPKGSFMIRGKKNFLKNLELKIAVGLTKKDDIFIPMAGPPNAIKKHCNTYIILKPGDKKRSEIAKVIKRQFLNSAKNDDEYKKIDLITLDDIIRLIPGESELLNKK